ncbi:uncharacterized protein ACA1_159110 [Acanthamoeba castellanii str. Neff]|uniref:Uncharacterized protein n=1 Tax=Acanthamoeba castellanii (strain ATCC 30010 / Neff) TaxID=1257118 RepID=L8H9F4_ACACF|nr:uncharacterized protein ACA1_159110 [Acanthamoeba castellanii str. Neff]ELR22114.1 hypothetical protein ACA1_159110 [Acanthamoeba castellanii str. Neff]
MAYVAPSVSAKQCGNTVPVELFMTTATASLPVKKDQHTTASTSPAMSPSAGDAPEERPEEAAPALHQWQGYDEALMLEEEGQLAPLFNP